MRDHALRALESCIPSIVNQLKPTCLPGDQKEAANCVQILAPSHLTAIVAFGSGAAKQRLKLLASKGKAKYVKDAASEALKALDMEEDKIFQQRSQQLLEEEAAQKRATEQARDSKIAKAKARKSKTANTKETVDLADEFNANKAILLEVTRAIESRSPESESQGLAMSAHISIEPMTASSAVHSIPDKSLPDSGRHPEG